MAKFFGRMFVWIGCCFVVFDVYDSTSALTYQEEIPVSFTFNRGLSLSVSASDLHIYNLVPGNSDESNIITVTTTSNNATGYVLTASVGNSTKNTTNLVNGSNNFASIATNASQSSLTTDNTWGYSISTNNGSSWSNYSGLPIFSSTTWKEIASTNANGTTSILFKIGAKASSSQAAGDYTNVINFTATTNYAPTTIGDLTYMQDFASLDTTEKANVLSSMTTGTQYQLADNRDNKTYFVSKLADGNVWMTQNLDYSIVYSGATINSTNTDVPSNYSVVLNNTSTTKESSWTSASPHSYDPGDLCWNGVITTDSSGTLENSTVACDQNGNHYHIGNYYNWAAALAVASISGYSAAGTDANQSICPAGWMLPKGGNSATSGSYDYLISQAGFTAGLSGDVHQSPYYFVYSTMRGLYVGRSGQYWTSVASNYTNGSYAFNFSSYDNSINVYGSDNRDMGYSVRCVAR